MDLCMSAPLEFAVMLGAGCVPAVMQQGEIYEGAGDVFWQEKRCVTIAAGPHWGLFSIPVTGMQAFLSLLQWLVVDITCTLGTKRSHVSAIRIWVCKSPSMTQQISCWELACAVYRMQIQQFACMYLFIFCWRWGYRELLCSSCQKTLTLRMWQGIPSFLLLSNVRDFLIWWRDQVAAHGGVCPQPAELPAFFFLRASCERLHPWWVSFGWL